MNCTLSCRWKCPLADVKFAKALNVYFLGRDPFDDTPPVQKSLNLSDLDARLVKRCDVSVRFTDIEIVAPYFEDRSPITKEICRELRLAHSKWENRWLLYGMETDIRYQMACHNLNIKPSPQGYKRFTLYRGKEYRWWKEQRNKKWTQTQ